MRKGVLFLCTANAARSQMAEGIARRFLAPDIPVWSAGTRPRGLDPRAVQALAEVDVDISDYDSKHLNDIPLDQVGLVITLCDEAAAACPSLPGVAVRHWGFADPARVPGPESFPAFQSVRDALVERIDALSAEFAPEPALGFLGGSGFYDLPGLEAVTQIHVDTPFGRPSDAYLVGRLHGRRVVFLARHGRGHRLLPYEVNSRANFYGFKRLGVTRVISISAVGSLREEIAPGDIVTPRQFIDRTVSRPATFFGSGVVAHCSLAEPVCGHLADSIADGARTEPGRVHAAGTYVCIEGPQFSTRAESDLFRQWGADLVGMTNHPEARLAREAEICYATLALPTDYDCWRPATREANVDDIMTVLRANVDKGRRIVTHVAEHVAPAAPCACRRNLDVALMTQPPLIDTAGRIRLQAILHRRLQAAQAA